MSDSSLLPSVRAARQFLNGEPGGLQAMVLSTIGRALIVGAGIAVAGERDTKVIAKHSLAAAVSLELFILYMLSRPKEQQPLLPGPVEQE